MNISSDPNQLKVATTYNAAADHFDAPQLGFWDRHGRAAVGYAALHPGARVLDVGCGTGASAIPAAEMVGPDGSVLGLDLAEKMLARAWDKARKAQLRNVTFRQADMTALKPLDEGYDAVISVFSLFFTADMERQVEVLWSQVKPGGRLVVTVWGPDAFQPGARLFSEELGRLRPDLPTLKRPWERLTEPGNLRRLLLDGGTSEPSIHPAKDRQSLTSPADWWSIAMGSGYRWEIEQLKPLEAERLRVAVERRLSEGDVKELETGAIHAVAVKPA